MTKKITEIYAEYKIMQNLQEHMFRVAAVASLICDNFEEPLPKDEIILACLFHDMGNIIKSQLDYFPAFNNPEGIDYWRGVQKEYVKKYGKDEHSATVQIMRELNLPDNIIYLVDQIDFFRICSQRNGDDFSSKIVIYADGRVDPHGVVSYDERMKEGAERYKNAKKTFSDNERQKMIACGKDIETQIFLKCRIKPQDINNESIKSVVLRLKDFVIK